MKSEKSSDEEKLTIQKRNKNNFKRLLFGNLAFFWNKRISFVFEPYFIKQDFSDEDLESIMQIDNEKLMIAFGNVFEMNSE